jgi:hypothetical protein
MQQFVDAVRQAIATSNWVSALATALALPDICGWLETPAVTSQKRYEAWFDTYMLERYTALVGRGDPPDKHVFLSGADCYALRCALLHEGSDSTERQRAREALTRFRFVAPQPGVEVHCNQVDSLLQLQVDLFCEDICEGVEDWSRRILVPGSEPRGRLSELLTIETLGDTVTL